MRKRVFSLLLAGLLALTMGTTAYATEDEIADMQAQRQEAQAGLAQAQANIDSLESKKQELENYLSDLNAQYEELTNAISELSIQAGEKENQLKEIKKELKAAKKAAQKQYEDMKLRIQYMYENGGTSTLEILLSSKDLAEFLNNAENVSKISQYDRKMLEKYENLQQMIKEKEESAQKEKEAIEGLLVQRAKMQQEVQAMAASTSDNISYYVAQISASEEEAAALTAQINYADRAITQLMEQAEQERAAREAAEAAENSYEDESDTQDDTYAENDETVYDESEAEDHEDTYEEDDYNESYDDYEDSNYEEDDYEDYEENADSETESEASSSGQGTYLGNFTLTAYCNCAQCCGTAGNLTASGTVPTAGRTVAMAGVPFGTQLLINGNVYTVEDLGTPYGHVDIFFNDHASALAFGLQSAEVYQLN